MAKKKQTQQTNPSTSKSAAFFSQNIQVNGILIEDSQTAPIEGFELVSTIDLRANRSGTAAPEFFDEEEFGVLTFEDGTEWIGYLGDMPEIFGESASTHSSSSQAFVLPTQLASTH